MSLTLAQFLQATVAQHRNAPATIFAARTQTYSEFSERVARLAAGLRSLGVRTGDRVGILALNSDHYLEVYFAVWWLGAVINPVNTRWNLDEVRFSLDDCDTRLLFVDAAFKQAGVELLRDSSALQQLVHLGDEPENPVSCNTLVGANAPIEEEPVADDALAGIFYTGGTTGRPKGVMLSHSALVLNTMLSLLAAPVRGAARLLQATPLFHLAGLAQTLRFLMVGATVSIQPTFVAADVLAAIEKQRITHLATVPTMLQLLANAAEQTRADVSSVAWVVYGASPIGEAQLDSAMRLFDRAEFVQGYGMTETAAAITYLGSEHHSAEGRAKGRLASAGRPLPCIRVRIVDAAGTALGANQVGEIVVRSPCLMHGYWNRPEDTARAFLDGWFRTGDVGYMDPDGFLFVVDRLKDMIISGGENVYSGEVESAIARHPGVAAVAVFGIPDARWGEAVHAVVVTKPGASLQAEDVQSHCRSQIAHYKCPRSVEFVEALPMSGAGKILKFKLREAYWGSRNRNVA